MWYQRNAKDSDVPSSAFPASDLARAVTGAAIPVYCGLTAGNIVMASELTLEDF